MNVNAQGGGQALLAMLGGGSKANGVRVGMGGPVGGQQQQMGPVGGQQQQMGQQRQQQQQQQQQQMVPPLGAPHYPMGMPNPNVPRPGMPQNMQMPNVRPGMPPNMMPNMMPPGFNPMMAQGRGMPPNMQGMPMPNTGNIPPGFNPAMVGQMPMHMMPTIQGGPQGGQMPMVRPVAGQQVNLSTLFGGGGGGGGLPPGSPAQAPHR